jgi:hypothetical protein
MRLKETPRAASSAGPSVGARASRSPPPSSPAVSRSRLSGRETVAARIQARTKAPATTARPIAPRRSQLRCTRSTTDSREDVHPHRADDLASVDDGDGDEQKIASGSLAEAAPRVDAPLGEGDSELRPLHRGEPRAGRRLPGTVHQHASAVVRHNDSLGHGRRGRVHRFGQGGGARVRRFLVHGRHLVGDPGGEKRGPAEDVGLKVGVRPPLDAERERDLEREDDRGTR